MAYLDVFNVYETPRLMYFITKELIRTTIIKKEIIEASFSG